MDHEIWTILAYFVFSGLRLVFVEKLDLLTLWSVVVPIIVVVDIVLVSQVQQTRFRMETLLRFIGQLQANSRTSVKKLLESFTDPDSSRKVHVHVFLCPCQAPVVRSTLPYFCDPGSVPPVSQPAQLGYRHILLNTYRECRRCEQGYQQHCEWYEQRNRRTLGFITDMHTSTSKKKCYLCLASQRLSVSNTVAESNKR